MTQATGDLIRTAVVVGNGEVSVEDMLAWLGDVLRPLRAGRTGECPPAGCFVTAVAKGTVEIRPPGVGLPAGRVLDFRASPELVEAVVAPNVASAVALGAAGGPGGAFALALALELRETGRAQIGNLGAWSLGRLPDLTVFVRFRAHPASARMF